VVAGAIAVLPVLIFSRYFHVVGLGAAVLGMLADRMSIEFVHRSIAWPPTAHFRAP